MLIARRSVAAGAPHLPGTLAPSEIKHFAPASALGMLCELELALFETRIGNYL